MKNISHIKVRLGLVFLICFNIGSAWGRSPLESKGHQATHLRHSARVEREDVSNVDVQSYHLNGRFNWETRLLEATVTIRFKLLDSSNQKIVLDSEVSRIESVTLENGDALPFEIQGDLLSIDLSGVGVGQDEEGALKIKYQADGKFLHAEWTHLHPVEVRKGDPIQAKVVYTTSEPLGAEVWMPCHNQPSDRARFSTDFVMPLNFDFISNGDRIESTVTSDFKRRVKYSTHYSLPTYLMAFAMGNLVTETQYHNQLPVSVVYRPGLQFDSQTFLKRVIGMISHMEKLLIPYPYEKYMVVLLPEFSAGGIEHAGITFQAENRSTEIDLQSDFWLTAHELGHQWFGDLTTVGDWDTLWFKEGMATLLADEAMRVSTDLSHSGRKLGSRFEPEDGVAIMDLALPADEKYTSGPYDRSAWNYTQIREVMGEHKFWGFLRGILKRYAFSSITSKQFLSELASATDAAFAARAEKAILAKSLPKLLATEISRGANSRKISLHWEDTDSALLAPLWIRVVGQNGSKAYRLAETGSLELELRDSDLLLLDANDVHPISILLGSDEASEKLLRPYLVPKTSQQLAVLLGASPQHQELVIQKAEDWQLSPALVGRLIAGMKSRDGKYQALRLACEVAKKSSEKPGWAEAILPWLSNLQRVGINGRGIHGGLSDCSEVVGKEAMDRIWIHETQVIEGGAAATATRLTLFAFPATEVSMRWKPVFEKGSSVRVRELALRHYIKHIMGSGSYEKPEATLLEDWQRYFREEFVTNEVTDIQEDLMSIFVETKDTSSVPLLVRYINSPVSLMRKDAICAAYKITEGDESAWKGFADSLVTAQLPGYLQKVVSEPSSCGKDE